MEQIQDNKPTEAICRYTAKKLILAKKSSAEIRQALLEKGMDEKSADELVADITNQLNTEKKEIAEKDMRHGALWCIGGILVTVLTYSAAGGHGTYIIAWGAMLFGAIQFFKGLFNIE
jgi:hypothetical protein